MILFAKDLGIAVAYGLAIGLGLIVIEVAGLREMMGVDAVTPDRIGGIVAGWIIGYVSGRRSIRG